MEVDACSWYTCAEAQMEVQGMTTQPFDPVQFKNAQRQEWDTVAAGWKKWWETIERGTQHVSARPVELAQIQPGHQVLDVATGIGEPAVTAAHRVGANGHVVATDQSPQMLAIAQERAAAQGLQHIEFKVMDAEALEFPENTFDAVLCRWGLMFLPDVAAALEGVLRALHPGGRLATCVWDVPPKTPMISLAMGVIQRMFQLPPPPPGVPGPFALADSAVLEQAFIRAGFTDVHSERMTVTIEFPSATAYTDFLRDIAPPVSALLANQPAERQTEAWQAISTAAGQFSAGDGSVHMPNETILMVGCR